MLPWAGFEGPPPNYFSAKRTERLVFITVGLLALLASTACVIVLRKPLFSGWALTMSVVVMLQLSEGIRSEELLRMRVVMRSFKICLGVEVALLILGLIAIPFAAPGGFIRGAATALALQAGFTAMLDLAATRRGDAHLKGLRSRS